MQPEQSTYNIYCDESRVENKDYDLMAIGALIIPRHKKDEITAFLKSLFTQHKFTHELKWVKVRDNYERFYEALIGYFLENPDIQFRSIVVDRTKLDYKKFHDSDEELAFFKFYYLLLKAKLLNETNYYIFLDKKPTRDKNRARALHSVLNSYVLVNKYKCNIVHLQAYDSKENILIQFSDFLTGLISHDCNRGIEDNIKGRLITYLAKHSGKEGLCQTTPLAEGKFNVFCWEPKV